MVVLLLECSSVVAAVVVVVVTGGGVSIIKNSFLTGAYPLRTADDVSVLGVDDVTVVGASDMSDSGVFDVCCVPENHKSCVEFGVQREN